MRQLRLQLALMLLRLLVVTAAHVGFRTRLASTARSLLRIDLPKDLKYILPEAKFVTADPNTTQPLRLSHHRTDLEPDAAVRHRCSVARGTWCGEYLRQERVPTRPVPRCSLECPNACSGWGNCNYDTGLCDCPAGRGGPDCGQEVKRPCASGHRAAGNPNNPIPVSSIGPDGLDLNVTAPGWTASRCFGYCWSDVAACFCGEGQYRHIPAPPGSPPWTPPVQWGRPLSDACQPGKDAHGRPSFIPNSAHSYADIYGPNGWCNKLDGPQRCGCFLELAWPCDQSVPMEQTCANQCSGHGECFFGFCRCHPGWYGSDCSRKKAGLEMEPGLHESARPWIREFTVTPPAALPVPAAPSRPRPLIYVYDIPPEYTSRMLQYRVFADTCVWRRFWDGNSTGLTGWTYSIETLMHELMLQSEHRTFDPEEADFFYVPMYVACYFWPILGWADFPWWHAPDGLRPMHGANMITEVHDWLTSNFPWWRRRGGRDHIWLMAHDEGACWMPKAVYDTSIVLTHWGRMDPDHVSATAFAQDNYSAIVNAAYDGWRGLDFKDRIRGHPCYDPKKDLVIPAFKTPHHFSLSPLLGGPPLERDILLYFRGDVGAHRDNRYSRGVRQTLFRLSVANNWFEKHRIVIATGDLVNGDYGEHLARSKFCLVAPGDGWSPRAEDALLHGCVPLVVMDGVHAVFESILDWDSFALRIRENALESVPDILEAVPPERLAKMQRNIARVWHRFAYTSTPLLRRVLNEQLTANAVLRRDKGGAVPSDHPYQPATSFPVEDDAFGTIMQWLYHRIPDTR